MLTLHLPHTVEADWYNRDAEIFREQTNAGLKRRHAAVLGVVDFAFGENQHAVPAVHRFSGKTKAFAKAGQLWQGKNVKDRSDQPIAQPVAPASYKKPVARRVMHPLQGFRAHRRGHAMAEPHRQRGENQSDVRAAGDVIGDNKHRSSKFAEIFAPYYSRMPEDLRGRPGQRVINGQSKPTNGLPLSPKRIDITSPVMSGGGLLQKAFDVADRLSFRKGSLIEFHVELFFQRAHQLDAIERRES